MKHVVIAVPAYTGTAHLGTMRSLLHDTMALARRGDVYTLIDELGGAYICDIRAQHFAAFLGIPGATDLVFVDNDVCWQAGALLRLVDHPVDVVAGLYPRREDLLGFPVNLLEGITVPDPETGLLEVEGCAAGFLRITRQAADRMVEHYAGLVFNVAPYADGKERCPNNEAWDVFGTYRIGRRKLQDDYAFCRRWRDIGGKVWVDHSFPMGHFGLKMFTGRFGP